MPDDTEGFSSLFLNESQPFICAIREIPPPPPNSIHPISEEERSSEEEEGLSTHTNHPDHQAWPGTIIPFHLNSSLNISDGAYAPSNETSGPSGESYSKYHWNSRGSSKPFIDWNWVYHGRKDEYPDGTEL